MKTKVRVINPATITREVYEHFTIQILGNRWKSNPDSLDNIATISWQGTVSERDTREDYWYSPKIEVNCEFKDFDNFNKIAKLSKFIYDNSYHSIQPKELLLLIGAEYYMHDGCFIPVSYIGMSCFKIMKNGNFYSRIYAANEVQANKICNKKYEGCSIEYFYIVVAA